MAQMQIDWFAPSRTLDIGGSAAAGRQDRTLADLVFARRQAGELAAQGDMEGAAATLAKGGDMQGARSLYDLVSGREDRTNRREDRAADEAWRRDQAAKQDRQFQMTHGLQLQNQRFQQEQATRPEIVFKENEQGIQVPFQVRRTPNGIDLQPLSLPPNQPGITGQPAPQTASAIPPVPMGVDPKTWRGEQAKIAAKNLEETRTKAEAGADLIRKIDRAKKIVENADPANFGAFNNSGVMQGLRNTGAGLGFERDVATQQQRSGLEAMYEDMSSTFLKARYGSTQLSNVDMAASKALVGGLLSMNPKTAVQILENLTPESFDRIKDGVAKGVTMPAILQELQQGRQQGAATSANRNQAMQEAQAAIARGADPAKVQQRLRERGF